MSLIITRNNGSDPPESYHNYFKDTFEIRPHSQIAVHTCVINRDPSYVISDDDSVFYVYHGGYLSDAMVTKDEGGYENYLQFYGLNELWVDQPIMITLSKGGYSMRRGRQVLPMYTMSLKLLIILYILPLLYRVLLVICLLR